MRIPVEALEFYLGKNYKDIPFPEAILTLVDKGIKLNGKMTKTQMLIKIEKEYRKRDMKSLPMMNFR